MDMVKDYVSDLKSKLSDKDSEDTKKEDCFDRFQDNDISDIEELGRKYRTFELEQGRKFDEFGKRARLFTEEQLEKFKELFGRKNDLI